jgi:FkbM family methyltransferase
VIAAWSALVVSLVALACTAVFALRARRAVRSLWAVAGDLERRHAEALAADVRARAELWGALAGHRHGLPQPVRFSAQHGEDVYVWRRLGCRADGFFVEVGAYDGETLSNTYGLEQLGWRGILVEANPEVQERCRAARPRSTVVHAAVGGPSASGSARFSMARGAGTELLSFLDGEERQLRRIERAGGRVTHVDVPLRPLSDLLADAPPIDFMSIDVEGGELEALRGMDLRRHRPSVLMVENNDLPSNTDVKDYLEARGYRRDCVLGCNEVFVRADGPPDA